MKRLLFFGLLLLAKLSWAQDVPERPNPPRLVNDFAHVLTADQAGALEQKLKDYDDSTSSQIAIVTVETTGSYEVEEYALKILRSWGVGSKKNDNGIVILVAVNDHKMRIEVGYGLEGAVPDITSKDIIENDMAPNFRAGNYYRGLDQATDNIIKAAAGEYKATERPAGRNGRGGGGGSIIGFVFLFIIILVILSRINRGGGGGSGGGGFLTGMLLGSMLNRGGGWGGGGSDWGGGGGGGGGGGFGGFGGGSGGGGGASGSW